MDILLFILGTIFGSFTCVVAMRYDADRFIGDTRVIGGRSRCMSCGRDLRWFELIPIISFIIQRARCRSCKAPIAWQHFIVEIISGLLFVAIHARIAHGAIYLHQSPGVIAALSAVWIAVFMVLLLITLIDLRLYIIPDEAQIALVVLGILLGILESSHFVIPHDSLLGGYGYLFGGGTTIWMKQLLGFVVGGGALGLLVAITRGRGMGMGDVKLAAALGIVFAWPDISVLLGLSFIIGSLYALFAMFRRGATLKSAVPFGPFIALGALVLFFAGTTLATAYFGLLT
jgi:prepilin signal peptidase PulO-like enzyme (type II secretory pathway)